MRSSTSIIIAIIAAIVILGGAYLIWNSNANTTSSTVTVTPTGQTQTVQNASSTDYTPGSQTDNTQGSSLTGTVTTDTSVTTGTAPKTVTVTYNGSSFSPASVTIRKGDTVNFVATAGSMWVASAPHPSHTGYDGTDRATHCAAGYTGPAPFDQCSQGTSFSFTFTKTGSWQYHNHVNAGAHGTVVVK